MSSEGSSTKEDKTDIVYETELEFSSEFSSVDTWCSANTEASADLLQEELNDDGGSGEICTKYIAQSDSTVFRHPYHSYPAVLDPGIETAVLKPERSIIFAEDGQELYLATCEQMNQCPVRLFYTNLMQPEIDLSYYGVNPAGLRAMALALRLNKSVKVFNLTDNFLNIDACFHLGQTLSDNSCLTELNLSGCRIGPAGLKMLCAGLTVNSGLKILNLDRNQLGEKGGIMIAEVISKGTYVEELSLSKNDLGGETAASLYGAFLINNNLMKLDLSWNNLYTGETCNLVSCLGENSELEVLNLAWNSLSGDRIGTAVMNLLSATHLLHLDLSNNRLAGQAITNIASGLRRANKLVTLDLSFNPLTSADALKLVEKMTFHSVNLQRLLLDGVLVNQKFMEMRERILIEGMETEVEKIVTCAGLPEKSVQKTFDRRDLVLNRADFILKKPRKHKVDIALVALELVKDKVEDISVKDFGEIITQKGGLLDSDLIIEISEIFAGVKGKKAKIIDLNVLVEYMRRKWPERTLPPTPRLPTSPELKRKETATKKQRKVVNKGRR